MDTRGIGYLVVESKAGNEYWLKLPIGERWTAAYRLTFEGEGVRRRARIIELRVVPGRAGDFYPNRNYESWESRERASGRAATPFSFDAIRRGVTARLFADALAVVGTLIPHDDEPDDWGTPAFQLESASSKHRAAGRPGRPLTFYAKFAVRYSDVEHGTRRERGASTRAILARQYKVPVTTIGKWIRTARQHGFLTPVVRGQRGGMATNVARELSARGEK